MVMDPDFLAGLPEGVDGDRTKEFIAGACGVVCLQITVGPDSLVGQVTRQDGQPVATERVISAQVLTSGLASVLSVQSGTLITNAVAGVVFQTEENGSFELFMDVNPPAAILLHPDGGEAKLIVIPV